MNFQQGCQRRNGAALLLRKDFELCIRHEINNKAIKNEFDYAGLETYNIIFGRRWRYVFISLYRIPLQCNFWNIIIFFETLLSYLRKEAKKNYIIYSVNNISYCREKLHFNDVCNSHCFKIFLNRIEQSVDSLKPSISALIVLLPMLTKIFLTGELLNPGRS